MAAVAAGALVGSVMAALGGYTLYKLFNCFRGFRSSSVAPSSQPLGDHLEAEAGKQNAPGELATTDHD